jgi:hypothetical protein
LLQRTGFTPTVVSKRKSRRGSVASTKSMSCTADNLAIMRSSDFTREQARALKNKSAQIAREVYGRTPAAEVGPLAI